MTYVFNGRKGFIRIEYIIAAVICTLLIFGLVAVLVVYSVRPTPVQISRPITSTTEQPEARPAPTPPPPAPRAAPTPPPAPAPQVRNTPQQVPQTVPQTTPQPQSSQTVPLVRQPAPAPTVTGTRATNTNAYPNGQPHPISATGTSRIEAEDFDNGGEGFAYHDTTQANEGSTGRLNESMDVVGMMGGGTAIGYSANGEWLNYTVNVARAGQYRVSARVAGTGGKMRLLFNAMAKTGDVAVPSTGGFEDYRTVEIGTVQVDAGVQEMRVVIAAAHYNLDWIELTPVNGGGQVASVPTVPQSVPGATVPQPTVPAPTVPAPTTPQPVPSVPVPTVNGAQPQDVTANKVTDDGFENFRIGQRPAGEGWEVGGMGTATVQRSPQAEDQSLILSDLSRTEDVWVRRTFSSLHERATLTARIRFGSSSDGFGISLQGNKQHAAFIFTAGLQLSYEEPDGKIVQLAPFKPATWYELRVEANIKDKVYDVYLDNQQIGSRIKFRNSVGDISSWLAGSPPPLSGAMHIADIKVNGK